MHSPLPGRRRGFLGLATAGLVTAALVTLGTSPVAAQPSPVDPASTTNALANPQATPEGHDHFDDRAHGAITAIPKPNKAKGLVFSGLKVGTKGSCEGLLKVAKSGRCSHGPDVPMPGYSMDRAIAPLKPALANATGICFGDGTSGNRVQPLYVHATGNDRFAQYKSSFEQWAIGMDTIYNNSAKETGGIRHIRFVHSADCTPVVLNVAISASAMSDFGSMESALEKLGYNRKDRKYTVFGDASVYCGIGDFAGDTRKSDSNYSNFGPSFGRTDTNCWGPSTPSHELGHNLGAVNNNAPNASGGAHCTDEWDLMCYSDSPNYPKMRYVCNDKAKDALFDCNHDDYYNTNPAAGSYLSKNFNVADNIFLVKEDGPTPTPTVTTTSPTPTVTTTSPTPTVTTTSPTPTVTTTSPTPTVTTTSPTPTPTPCSSSSTKYNGNLEEGRWSIQPKGSYFYSSKSGVHTACLQGPAGSDFDVYLQKWYGYYWATVKSSTTPLAAEAISYNGTAGYYRYAVYASSGSGDFVLGVTKP